MAGRVLERGLPIVESGGHGRRALFEVVPVAQAEGTGTEDQDGEGDGESESAEAGVKEDGGCSHRDGDEPAGSGSGPDQAGQAEGAEEEKDSVEEDRAEAGAGGPEVDGQDREHEEDETGEGVGVDEGTVDAGALEFVEDGWVGDVESVGLDDKPGDAEFGEFRGGEVRPPGLLPEDEGFAGVAEFEGALIEGLEPAKAGAGADSEEERFPVAGSQDDAAGEADGDAEQVRERELGQLRIDGLSGAHDLPAEPTGQGNPDPGGQAGGGQALAPRGEEQDRGGDEGKEE